MVLEKEMITWVSKFKNFAGASSLCTRTRDDHLGLWDCESHHCLRDLKGVAEAQRGGRACTSGVLSVAASQRFGLRWPSAIGGHWLAALRPSAIVVRRMFAQNPSIPVAADRANDVCHLHGHSY